MFKILANCPQALSDRGIGPQPPLRDRISGPEQPL